MSLASSAGLERKFVARPDSLSEVRQFVTSALSDSDVDPTDVQILTSEVATNAIRHANTDFRVLVLVGEQAVRVEVINDAPELLLIKKEPSDAGGRGLHLLDDIARDWGVEAREHDKVVWFELNRHEAKPDVNDQRRG
jgi:anti-sigma regulatory factor (Ser/Thr protein kinase)